MLAAALGRSDARPAPNLRLFFLLNPIRNLGHDAFVDGDALDVLHLFLNFSDA